MSAVDAVRHDFVELWGSMATFWGISPTTARVHSFLLSQVEPPETEDIMQGLGLSRGAVSMACRELRDWGLVFQERLPGSRRTAYRPATDLERVIRNIVKTRKHREWDPILERLREWIPQLAADPSPEAALFRSRLDALEAMAKRLDAMLEVFLKGGLVSRFGLKLMTRAPSTTPAKKDNALVLVEETP